MKIYDVRLFVNCNEFKKKCLMEGLDDIALSMEKINQIDKFESKIN